MRAIGWTMASLMVALCGCGGGGASLGTWQRNLQEYVQKNDNDPNSLRDLTVDGDRRGFGAIGEPDPRRTTDARGVLLGHHVVAQRPWFIYLVGLVDEQKVEDIRLAAVSFTNGKATWRMSKADKRALQRYRNYNRELFRSRHTDRSRVPVEYLSFPREPDRFDLTITGNQLDATHVGSGAHWRLLLP